MAPPGEGNANGKRKNYCIYYASSSIDLVPKYGIAYKLELEPEYFCSFFSSDLIA
jgi:hypothetical protein